MDPRAPHNVTLEMIHDLEKKISTLETSDGKSGNWPKEINDAHFTAGNICFDYADMQKESAEKIKFFLKAGEHYNKVIEAIDPFNRNWKEHTKLTVELHLSKLAVWKKLAESADSNKQPYIDLIQHYIKSKNLEYIINYLADKDTKEHAQKDLKFYQFFCTAENNSQHTNILPLKKRPLVESHPIQQPSKKRLIENNASSNITYANLFTPKIKNDPFTHALKSLLALFIMQERHCASELLRKIASYHHKDCEKSNIKSGDILDITEFLYEKSLVIEPANNMAKEELAHYQSTASLRSNEPQQARVRKERYEQECKKFGYLKFFWLSITKYLERLEKNYPHHHDLNEKLIDVLLYLDNSGKLDQLTEQQQNKIGDIVANAINEMTPLSYPPPIRHY